MNATLPLNAPAFLLGAALVFWGWQSGNLAVGALLGVVLEGLRAPAADESNRVATSPESLFQLLQS